MKDIEPRSAKSVLTSVCESYRGTASEWVQRYEHVALLNGLEFHRAEEQCAVEMFNDALFRIARTWKSNGANGAPLLPTPADILATRPDVVGAVKTL